MPATKGKQRQEFKDYIDGLLEKTAANKSVYKIMQKENDLYESQEENRRVEENGDYATQQSTKILGNSCRQIISRITNIDKRGNSER